MSFSDLGILALCALVGWAVVSWIISVVQQQKRPPLDLTGASSAPREPRREPLRGLPSPAAFSDNGVRDMRALSLSEISARWSSILGIPESSSAQEIEAAYHASLAECDRIRFSPSESESAKSAAEARRAQITQAFEFIRPLKN